jgi:tRNA modification GTPase
LKKRVIDLREETTITAPATPQGRGGIGIIRISGPNAFLILCHISKLKQFSPRQAQFCAFHDDEGTLIDSGLALYFPKPASFTGEDVVELHVHGSPFVLDMLLEQVIALGAVAAQPGEFSYRAYINNKIDLIQAEAIADLIDSGSRHSARLASRSLKGKFSLRIAELVESITQLRMYIEASFDFSDEDLSLVPLDELPSQITELLNQLDMVILSAEMGRVMRDGLQLVLAGRPNAGKSSLLNCLTGEDSAIVTEVPGTTRDLLKEQINLDGIPLHLVDTAGLRESHDPVEALGIQRARTALESADHVLWVMDDLEEPMTSLVSELPEGIPVTLVHNKIDISGKPPTIQKHAGITEIWLSAKSGQGIEALKEHIKQSVGITDHQEGEFLARRRHLEALKRCRVHIVQSLHNYNEGIGSEFIAEELRLAQAELNEITGVFSSDDLLGKIFSSFCIGK